MKNFSLSILVIFLGISSFNLKAQTLEESLKLPYNQFDTASTVASITAASAAFDLVTSSFPEELMSNYYSAFSKAILSYNETVAARRDMILDQADMYFEKVKQLSPEGEETYILAALIANARLVIDGANRWKEYGKIFDDNLAKATAINPNNPRIHYLKGMSVFFTPKMFGGGAKKAKPLFETAKPLFAAQDISSILKPIWGSKQNEEFLLKCVE